MDHAHRARPDCREKIQTAPSKYLRKIYFDTVVFDAEHLAHLIRLYGADHIVLGTDYPYDMGESDPVALVDQLSHLSEAERAEVIGGNAARLLGISSRLEA